MGWVYGGVGITWAPYRCCGDDGVDVRITGTMWDPQRQHGDHRLGGWVMVYGVWRQCGMTGTMGIMWG